jgi:hypothetical protein
MPRLTIEELEDLGNKVNEAAQKVRNQELKGP